MDLGMISVRYARALLKGSLEAKTEDAVYQDMLTLGKSYADVPQLRRALDNPTLKADEKNKLIVTAMGNPTEMSRRFVSLVLKEGRENHLQFMATSYVTLYRKQKNIINGRLTTAVPVSDTMEQKMKQMVEKRTSATVEFETVVDPEVIGGFILEYDTYRMDASVRNQLKSISKLMNNA